MVLVQRIEEPQDRVILPWEAVHSEVTRDSYQRRSRQFLVFSGYMDPEFWSHANPTQSVVDREKRETERAMLAFIFDAGKDPKKARNQVLAFIDDLKRRMNEKDSNNRITPATAKNLLKPIKLALELNEVALPWKKFQRVIPPGSRSKDREYTLEELRTILQASSLHLKVAQLFMCSSGMRVGAFDYLDVGHVKPLVLKDQAVGGIVTVYAGEGDDEYETLVSREAYQAFLSYIQQRKSVGEQVRPESPLLVTRNKDRPRRMGGKLVSKCISDILWNVGLRTEKRRRHEVQTDHGYRKFFSNNAKDLMDENYVKRLYGHDLGTERHYDRRIPMKCIEQYVKAMPFLSIDSGYRSEGELAQELERVTEERDQELTDLRLKVLERESQIDALARRVEVQETTLKEVRDILRTIRPPTG